MSEKYTPEQVDEKLKGYYSPEDLDFIEDLDNKIPEITADQELLKVNPDEYDAVVYDRLRRLIHSKPAEREALILEYLNRIEDENLPQVERDACSEALVELQKLVDKGVVKRKGQF